MDTARNTQDPKQNQQEQQDQDKTAQPLMLWMPGLYGTGIRTALEDRLPAVRRLWPGLPGRLAAGEEGSAKPWTPDHLPCSEAEMGAFVAELERFAQDSVRGSDAVHEAVVARMKDEQEAQVRRDLAAIEALAQDGAGEEAAERQAELVRRRAQRLLAWTWHQQKTVAEITALVEKINAGVRGLGQGLSRDVDHEPVLEAGPLPLGQDLVQDAARMAGRWQVWLEAALALVPEGTAFVWEQCVPGAEMPADLQALQDRAEAGTIDGVSEVTVQAGKLLPASVASGLVDGRRSVRLLFVQEG